MMSSAQAVVEAIEHRLPRKCVDAASIAGIRTLAARLPAVFSSYYVECRLGRDAGPVDFLACIAASSRPARMRQLHEAVEWPPSGTAGAPAWEFAGAALRRWADPTAGGSARLPFLWLEFDDVGARRWYGPPPSLCVCLDRSYPQVQILPPVGGNRDGLALALELLRPALPPGHASELATVRCSLLERLFEPLPSTGRIIHLSCMLAREPTALKLFGSIPAEQLFDYLAAIAWPGPRDALQRALGAFCTPETVDQTVYFDLSVDRALSGYIGIATSQLQLRRASCADPNRRTLLGRFVEQGLCTADERDSLAAWAGHAVEIGSSARVIRIVRWLDTKLCIHSDGRSTAKAYLGFAPIASVF